MEIYNVLKKVGEKLASSSEYDLAKQKLDFEMGDLALTCVRNKRAMSIANNSKSNKYANIDLSAIKDKIVNSASSLKNTLENTPGAKTLGYGLGGMGIGSLLGSYLTSDKSKDETDEQYRDRKRESAITGGIAGTALGVSAPSLINMIKGSISSDQGPKKNLIARGIDTVAGATVTPTTATMGIGATGGIAANKILNYLNSAEISSQVSHLKPGISADAEKKVLERIAELKGKSPLIGEIKVPPINIPFKPTIAQKLLPTLNKVLAHSSRGKMLPIAGAISAWIGKKYLDSSAFNEPILE